MTPEIRAWMENMVPVLQPQGPVLEVGARNVNGTVRDLFPADYIGMDIEEGEGVDVVGDVLRLSRVALPHPKFGTIICCETLEHVTRPWIAVEQMARRLEDRGLLIVTVPFMHPLHGYPQDYWRMTGDGLRVLFEDAGLHCMEATTAGDTTYGVGVRACE